MNNNLFSLTASEKAFVASFGITQDPKYAGHASKRVRKPNPKARRLVEHKGGDCKVCGEPNDGRTDHRNCRKVEGQFGTFVKHFVNQ